MARLVLRNPRNQQIADCLGFNDAIDQTHVRDLVIIGAGPSGLAAQYMALQKGLTFWCWKRVRQAARQVQVKNRKLFGISQRYLGPGARSSGVPPGAEVRRGDAHSQGYATPLRTQTVQSKSRMESNSCAHSRDCDWGGVSKPGHLKTCCALKARGSITAVTFVEAQLCRGEEVIVVAWRKLSRPGCLRFWRRRQRACTCWSGQPVWPRVCHAI